MADNTLKIQLETVIEQQVDKQQEYRLVAQMRLKRGLSVFYYDMNTGEVEKLEIKKKVAIGYDKKVKKTNEAQDKKNCIYVQALNKKNAIKKFKKMIDAAKKIRDGQGGNASK